jgi:hypothetical protein
MIVFKKNAPWKTEMEFDAITVIVDQVDFAITGGLLLTSKHFSLNMFPGAVYTALTPAQRTRVDAIAARMSTRCFVTHHQPNQWHVPYTGIMFRIRPLESQVPVTRLIAPAPADVPLPWPLL